MSMDCPNSKTIMLTGRNTLYAERVEGILSSFGLHFDRYGFQPVEKLLTTTEFKFQYLDQAIQDFKPNVVQMWDDRESFVKRFREHLAAKHPKIKSTVYFVNPAGETYLEKNMELELISLLK